MQPGASPWRSPGVAARSPSWRQVKSMAKRLPVDLLEQVHRFRLKYRDAFIEVVGEIIRRGLKPKAEEIDALAVPLVLPEDLE
jgi:hypothetical protein